MTAKKAKAPKEQAAGIEDRLKDLKFEAAKAASAAAVEASKIFDAKSAEAADVGQEEEDPHGEIEAATKDLDARVKICTDALVELEKQISRKAPEELGEWISDVESKQGQRLAVLESQLSDLVLDHHDRLLQLEMKVTALSGEDEVGPGPG